MSCMGSASASMWWLRSANSTSNFYLVYTSGGNSNSNANNSRAVPLGSFPARQSRRNRNQSGLERRRA